ncbi:uncharacterized protein METZ01_LOCUS73849 [marine metagenome]|uniref:Uncharacterized protein n=1 Tax=marine metagenome TaxID=408172 RepID=A0A381TYC2_9ZZZZ
MFDPGSIEARASGPARGDHPKSEIRQIVAQSSSDVPRSSDDYDIVTIRGSGGVVGHRVGISQQVISTDDTNRSSDPRGVRGRPSRPYRFADVSENSRQGPMRVASGR